MSDMPDIPECFGTFWCPDDCWVSCPYASECESKFAQEEDEERAELFDDGDDEEEDD